MEDGTPASRRRVLAAVGAAAVAGLTGCSEDSGTPADEPTTTPTDPSPGAPSPMPTPGPTPTPVPTPTVTPTPERAGSLSERGRRFVELLAAGDYEAAYERTDGALARQLSPVALGNLWTSQVAEHGAFEDVDGVETRPASGGVAVLVTVQFERRPRLFRLVYGGDGGSVVPTDAATESDGDRSVIGLLVLAPYSPPAYADRDAFAERSLELTATDDCRLPAALSLPNGDGSVPGAVIVHGSGPTDMDGAIGAKRPYRDLAWGLASRGVAVLRYDKRTRRCSIPPAETTVDSVVVDDALAAAGRLRDHDRVDGVTVVGHSLGGALAPRIAARDGDLRGTIHLAANAQPLYRKVLVQTQYLAERDGRVTDDERAEIEGIRTAVDRIERGDYDPEETVLGAPGAFWESLRSYDRFETARSLDAPMRFLQGTADWQVTVEGDLARWRSTLDRESVTVRTFEGLTHRFAATTDHPAGAAASGNVARRVVEDVASNV
jgi:dienelactone hydrolase